MDAKLEMSNLITPIISAFGALNDEWSEFIEKGLSEYIYSQTDKYYYTNTFIHRSEKVKFRDIYYPIKAQYGKLITDFSDLNSVLDEYKYITIIGSAGSGKTTLIKYIFLNSISQKTRIPILIELRNLNGYQGNFEKLIAEKVLDSRLKPNSRIFKRTLLSGKFLFLLDGYDEIFSDKKQEINRQLEAFVDTYSANKFILTTRPGSGIEGFNRFRNFDVVSLNANDIVGFVNNIVEDEESRGRIIDIIKSPDNPDYLEFLRNPLLLSMFILAFKSHPEIPGSKSAFYKNVFDTLYSKHDSITKNSFPREKLTKLKSNDFEKILCLLSYFTLLEGKYTFTYEYLFSILERVDQHYKYNVILDHLIYDLHTSISIIIRDGFEYSFPHRSMQEYFAALFISKLDSDKRGKAYNNLAITLERFSEDYSFTFWSLCYELDEIVFIRSFLVPKLKLIHSALSDKEGRDLTKAYISFAKPYIYSDRRGTTYIYAIHPNSSLLNSVLEFCHTQYPIDIFAFLRTSKLESQLFTLEKELGEKIDFKNPLVFDLIDKHNFSDLIKILRKEISDKIQKWEEYVTQQRHDIDDLLSI
ncbi:NACHT domain-containing protein [Hymenobacter nivis]|uniref:NACHT domain-containing protein n=1 Tax=Hymenobacter nivis TaxID=1850093 RepID=A0A502GYF1_9BACT|nr:NACHT domain-containing protein [Hymenobacter nivis]TPG66066.1 NACHT domain-containing protein [Hymenobacter nivis]